MGLLLCSLPDPGLLLGKGKLSQGLQMSHGHARCHHTVSLTGSHLPQGSSAQEGSTTLGLEPRLLGRLVGVSLGGDSVTSGNGSDGKTPAAKTTGYKRLGERERRPGRLPARPEKPP